MSQSEIYRNAGFGHSVPRGTRPAIVVVDFTYGFTDTQYPTASDASTQIRATRRLTDLARTKGFPVIYTVIAYHPGEVGTLAWLRKARGMADLLEGSRLVEVDAATGIQPEDTIIVKKGASAFFGTNFAGLLASQSVDTLVVTGATTSGCIRATAVDAVQSGFNVLVAGDCCADRAQPPHDAALYDIGQKYGDVTNADDIEAWLTGLPDAAA